MPDRVRELDRKLMAHLEEVGAKLPRANPDYKPQAQRARAGDRKKSGREGGRRRPRVLLLGDSISIGYTPFVQEMLRDEAVVIRPMVNAKRPENCQGTNHGVRHLDRWLALEGGRWDVIHFNFGLHDIKRVHPETGKASSDPSHPRQAPPERYEKQLREIVVKLERTGARLIFATTTPVPPGGVRPHRDVEDPERYNELATKIMREKGVAVNDLYRFARGRLKDIQRPVNVHFTPAGSRALAAQVVDHIRRALKR
jgi:acyl-CoA thioesterase-1